MMFYGKDLQIGYDESLFSTDELSIEKGEFIGVTGLNGCGKSTFLNCLRGDHQLTPGSLSLNGIPITDYSLKELAKLVAYSNNRFSSYGNTTVHDVVSAGRIPHTGAFSYMTNKDKDIVEEMMELMGVSTFQNRVFLSLSDGERQKCLLAKCLAQSTNTILLDEPMAFLDHPSRIRTYKTLQKLSKEHDKLILMTGHEPNMLKEFCSSILLISDGKLTSDKQSTFEVEWSRFLST